MRSFLFSILLFILFFIGLPFQAKTQETNVMLIVTTNDGTEQTFQLSHEGQLYFEDGERLVIEDGTGSVTTFQLGTIRKLVCTEITGVNESNASELLLTPNPTRDHFLVSNLKNSCEARIYALDGRLMKTFMATEGMVVDISNMSSGMYLLHIDGQTLKMMKL